ncbi:MAG: group 1 glycosyl transferase [Rhodospirillaceae bacterium]|nr:MAG: group 1 glycosyl transferase [Rhodospirillaceae bacterium]
MRWLLGAQIIIMSVSIPEQLYQDHHLSLSRLPSWLERLFIALTYRAAHRILTCRAFGAFVPILSRNPLAKDKLLVVDTLPSAMPTEAFFQWATTFPAHSGKPAPVFRLIYVGRLHVEKLVEDLIQVMALLPRHTAPRFVLKLIGDGPDRHRLEAMAKDLGVQDIVEFAGYYPNERVAEELMAADCFLSPLTGTSLREAALLGVPIIVYERDWVVGLLTHGENALMVTSRDIDAMARGVMRLAEDEALRRRLSENIRTLAQQLWTFDKLNTSLAQIHDAVR